MDVLRQLLSVVLVFSLLGAVLWALRRGGRISIQGLSGLAMKRALGPKQSIVAVGRLALTPHHILHNLQIDGREVLVVTHPQGCSVITTVPQRSIGAQA